MLMFKKPLYIKIISVLISTAFLCNAFLYADPASKDSLRTNIGNYSRVNKIIENKDPEVRIASAEIKGYAWLEMIYKGIKYAVDFHRKAPDGEDIPDIDITIGTINRDGSYTLLETYYTSKDITDTTHKRLVACAFNCQTIQDGLKQSIWSEFTKHFKEFMPIGEARSRDTEEQDAQRLAIQRQEAEEQRKRKEVQQRQEAEEQRGREEERKIRLAEEERERQRKFEVISSARRQEEQRKKEVLRQQRQKEIEEEIERRGIARQARLEQEKRERLAAEQQRIIEAEERRAEKKTRLESMAEQKARLRETTAQKGEVFKNAVVIEVLEGRKGMRLSLQSASSVDKGEGILMAGLMSPSTSQRKLQKGDRLNVVVVSTKKGRITLREERLQEEAAVFQKGQQVEGIIEKNIDGGRYNVRIPDSETFLIANEIGLNKRGLKRLKTGQKVLIEVKSSRGPISTCRITAIIKEVPKPAVIEPISQVSEGPKSVYEAKSHPETTRISLGMRLLRLFRPRLKKGEKYAATIVAILEDNRYRVLLPDGRKAIADQISLEHSSLLTIGSRVNIVIHDTEPEPTCKIESFIEDGSGTKGYPSVPEEIAVSVCEALFNDRAISFVSGDIARSYAERANHMVNSAREEDGLYRLCTADKNISSVRLFEIADDKEEYISKPFKAKLRNTVNTYQIQYRKGDKFFTLVNTETKAKYEVNVLHRLSAVSGGLELIAPLALCERMKDELREDDRDAVFAQLCIHELTEFNFNIRSSEDKQSLFTQIFNHFGKAGLKDVFVKHVRGRFTALIRTDIEGKIMVSNLEDIGEAMANFAELYHTLQRNPERYHNNMAIVPMSLLDRYCDDVDLKPLERDSQQKGTWTIEAFGKEQTISFPIIDALADDDAETLYKGIAEVIGVDSGVDSRLFMFGHTEESPLDDMTFLHHALIGFARLHNKGFQPPVILGDVDPDEYFKSNNPTVIGVLAYWDEDPMRLLKEGNEKTNARFFQVTSFSLREEEIMGQTCYSPVMHAGFCYNPKNNRWEYMRFTKPVPLHYVRVAGFEELIRRKLEKSRFPMLEPTPIDETTTNKALTYKVLKESGVRVASQIVFRRKLSTETLFELTTDDGVTTLKQEEIERGLRDFMDKEGIDEIVVKPQDGSQGEGVRFFDRRYVSDAAAYIRILSKRRGVVVEERIVSKPLIINGERYDWNARVFVSRNENEEFVVSDMVIRYDLYEKRSAVNISTGAKTMTFDEMAKHMGLSALDKKDLYQRIESEALMQARALEAYLVFGDEFSTYQRGPLGTGSYLRPDFLGCDIIDTGTESVGIEMNDGHSGGIWYLKGGHPLDELTKVMRKRAEDYKKAIQEIRSKKGASVDIHIGEQAVLLTGKVPKSLIVGQKEHEEDALKATRIAYSRFDSSQIFNIGVNTLFEAYQNKTLDEAIQSIAIFRYAAERFSDNPRLRLNVLIYSAIGCYIRDMISGGDYSESRAWIEKAMQDHNPIEIRRIGIDTIRKTQQSQSPLDAIGALLILRHVTDLLPKDPVSWLNLGSAYLAKTYVMGGSDFAESLACLNHALELTSEDKKALLFEIYSNLGAVFTVQNAFEDAIRMNEKSLEFVEYAEDPDYRKYASYVTRLGIASMYNRIGKDAEALKRLELLRKEEPDDPSIYLQLGVTYYNLNRYDESLKALDNALVLKPDNPEACIQIARWYTAKGDLKEAAGFLEKALESSPENANVYIAFSELAQNLGEYDLAINYATAAKKLEPDNYRPYFMIGQCYTLTKQGNYRKAVENLQVAAELNASIEPVWHALGRAYFDMHHWKEAKRCFERAQALNADKGYLYIDRGASFLVSHEYEQALEAFKKAREKIDRQDSPELAIICFYEAWAYRKLGNFEEAGRFLDEAGKLDVNAPHYPRYQLLFERGRLYTAKGQYEKALECFVACRRMEDGKNHDAMVYAHLGYIYEKLGNMRRANDSYQKLAEAISLKDSFRIKYYPATTNLPKPAAVEQLLPVPEERLIQADL
jgi:tetratricopeptide (TPR) repeat protein